MSVVLVNKVDFSMVSQKTSVYKSGVNGREFYCTCNTGYVFDGTPKCVIINTSTSQEDELEVTLDSNKSKATCWQKEVAIPNYCEVTWTGSTTTKKSYVEPSITDNVESTSTEITYGTNYAVIDLKCNDGYIFDGTPKAVLTYDDDPFSDEVEISLSVNTDGNIATGQVLLSDLSQECTITFTGKTKSAAKPTPTFVNNIDNTTWEHVYDGDKYKITVTCDSGYVFADTVQINYKNLETEVQNTVEMTLDDTKTVAYLELTTSEYTDLTTIGDTIPYSTPTYVTNNVLNASYSGSVVGTLVTGKLNANATNGAFVNVTAKYTNTSSEDVEVSLKPNSSFDTTIKVSLSDVLTKTEVVLSGSYRGVCKTENNVTGCSVLNLQDFYIESDKVNIALTANNGTSFDEDNKPKLIWYDVLSTPTEVEFNLSDDKKKADISWNMPTNKDDIEYTVLEITGSTIPDTTIKGYGSINVYKVDIDALDKFATARFKYKDTTETGLTPDGDLGEYVNRLHKLYCPVGETTPTTIKCGNNDTAISCESINNAVVNVDFGFVTIPTYNKSKADINTLIKVFVPFVGFVDISGEYSGETLFLSYDIDVVTGDGVYTIQAPDNVVTQGICDCSNEVIYRTSQTETLNTIGSDRFKSNYLLGLKPYALVKHYNEMSDTTNNTLQQLTLGDITGFAKFDDVVLPEMECLSNEREEIKNLLTSGVYL